MLFDETLLNLTDFIEI